MISTNDTERKQHDICKQYKCEFVATTPESKLGIALRTVGNLPVNGLGGTAKTA